MSGIFATKSPRRFKVLLVHVAIWVTFLSVNLIHIYTNDGRIAYRFLLLMASNIVLFYINYYYLVPVFLLRKKIIPYIIFAVLIVASPPLIRKAFIKRNMPDRPVMAMKTQVNDSTGRVVIARGAGGAQKMMREMEEEFQRAEASGEVRTEQRKVRLFSPLFLFYTPMLVNLAFLVIGTSIRTYAEWNKNEIKKREIEEQKSRAELNFLKNQLSPHFLFNSLNSIYSLTRKNTTDASEAVITLSELMRYTLYEADHDLVLLRDELDYIQNYIALQRLRLANDENVTIDIRGDIAKQQIKPLLLISFIENAFKYGTDFQGNTEVRIKIHVQDNHLEFESINLIGHRREKTANSGIGLKNTRERLELLYPDRYKLQVLDEGEKFTVLLNLELE